MSEYQYIAFQAIDGPVTEKNLQYMECQSPRAQITRWSSLEYRWAALNLRKSKQLQPELLL